MKTRIHPPRAMRGLSLVELMIAMVIGLIMLLAVVQIFSASRAASRLSEGAARTQENARFALDFLERDIRMAGHMGCVNDQAHIVKAADAIRINLAGITPGAGSPVDFNIPIQGYDAPSSAPGSTLTLGGTWAGVATAPDSITGLSPAPLGGSDILVLRYLAPEAAPVLTIAPAANSTLTISSAAATRLTAGLSGSPSLFAVGDCSGVDIFAGTLAGTTVTATNTNLARYAANNAVTMLYRAEAMVYYIANNSATPAQPSLYRARANGNGVYQTGEELVEGIESLQFLYGLDQATNITLYQPPSGKITGQQPAGQVSTAANATAVGAWRRVGLVQVGLLARSPQPAAAAQPNAAIAKHGVLGVTFDNATTSDNRYRASYEVSVALRNRLFGN